MTRGAALTPLRGRWRRLGRLEVDEMYAGSVVSRTLLRLAQRSFTRLPLGAEPVSLRTLVYPLRYDIEVRMEFFRRMSALRQDDLASAVAEARASSYWTWFTDVVPLRNQKLRNAGPAELAVAFERRVLRSLVLAESFGQRGFDRTFPVYLRRPEQVEATSSGKHVDRTHFPIDGCHRIALLLLSGRTELQPGEYREERVSAFCPTDNTAILARSLPLSPADYLSFLARGYEVEGQASCAVLLEAIEAQHPERLAEAVRVVTADRDLLEPGS